MVLDSARPVPGKPGPMSFEGLSGLLNRMIAGAERLLREHDVLGFPYAVSATVSFPRGGRR